MKNKNSLQPTKFTYTPQNHLHVKEEMDGVVS